MANRYKYLYNYNHLFTFTFYIFFLFTMTPPLTPRHSSLHKHVLSRKMDFFLLSNVLIHHTIVQNNVALLT